MHRSAQTDNKNNREALIPLKVKLMTLDVNWDGVAPNTDGLDQLKQKADCEREALEKKEADRKRKAPADFLQPASKRSHMPPSSAGTVRLLR
jgi:hypothetical protein